MAEYIDKAYALEILQQSGGAYGTFSVERSMYLIAKQKIKNIAPADVVPVKHGKWEEIENTGFVNGNYNCTPRIRCSECHEDSTCEVKLYGEQDDIFCLLTWVKTKYCPSCGAKMDLKEETK